MNWLQMHCPLVAGCRFQIIALSWIWVETLGLHGSSSCDWLNGPESIPNFLNRKKKKIINVYILKCIQAHNYVSWQPKHIISSDSTLGTWQTATHTSIHASANNNISFVRQREAILCKTDCMERKIIPFMPSFFFFFTFPHTHTNQTVSRNMLTSCTDDAHKRFHAKV